MTGAQQDILDCLRLLENGLGAYEQTTHGSCQGLTIAEVCEQIAATYKNPTSYEISELSQRISNFLEMEKSRGHEAS